MTWVWEHSRAKPTDRFILLAIADNAEDDGTNAFPTTDLLMKKTGYSEATIREAVKRLVRIGELIVERQAGEHPRKRYYSPRHKPNYYVLPMGRSPEELEEIGVKDPKSGVQIPDPTADSGVQIPDPTGVQETAIVGSRSRTPRKTEPSEGQPSFDPSFELPPSPAKPSKPLSPDQALLNAWWETQNPKPTQPYIACLKIVRKFLAAGWPAEDIRWALDNAPVVSCGAMTMALNQRRGRGNGQQSTMQNGLRLLRERGAIQ